MIFVPSELKLLVSCGPPNALTIPITPLFPEPLGTHRCLKSQTSPGPGVVGTMTGNVLVEVPVLKGTVPGLKEFANN